MMAVPDEVLDVRFPVGDTTVLEPRFALELVAALPVALGALAALVGRFAATPEAFAFLDAFLATSLGADGNAVAFETAVPEVADRELPAGCVGGGGMARTRRCGPAVVCGTFACLAVLGRGAAPLTDFLPEKKLSQPMDETPRVSDLSPPKATSIASISGGRQAPRFTSTPADPRSAGVYLQPSKQPGLS